MGRKSLKGLSDRLKSFASELSSKNIRYTIGNQALIVPYIYDYIDENMPVLKRMYQKRLKAYSALGYVALNE